MSSEPVADRTDPRAARHARSRSKILEEAWVLARRHGLGRLSLGELARSVGLRQPSLYTYFDSKAGLYDAMFAQGNEQLWEEVASHSYSEHPKEAVKDFTRAVVAFCAADPTRFQLLFQRPIPGFEPSEESYALALRFYERGRDLAAGAGITRQKDMDIFTALVAGIADQQVANDPGGDRWLQLVDEVIEMFLDRLSA